jgi:O-acetyl-ADP-ribose deacetylase (regulator of RNase III)
MFERGSGDLLAADVEALVNAVNCVGVMGKGIALAFKQRYPENYRRYRAACGRGEVALGRMFVVELATPMPRYVVNFPTKDHWRSPAHLADIETGLNDLVRVIEDRDIRSIAMPALGAGNGGLAWAEVEPLIKSRLGELNGVRTVLYPPLP